LTAEGENDKLLLAARKIRRATCSDFIVSLVSDDFSRASNTYVGKLRQVLDVSSLYLILPKLFSVLVPNNSLNNLCQVQLFGNQVHYV
jgi:hypothetical protein